MAGKRISSEMLKTFSGEGDVVAWLSKVKLVAKLQDIADVASLIPLYLDGDALALYLEMREEDRLSADAIEEKLKEAFTEGSFVAYGKLSRMVWTGESVDVFANNIRRLAGLAGFNGGGLRQMVKMAFINGFPDHISIALQQLPGVNTMEVAELITQARVLARQKEREQGSVAVAQRSKLQQEIVKDEEPRGLWQRPRFAGRCYRCQGPHMARECREPKPEVTCYRCGKVGHISRFCPQGNGQGEATAPVATPLIR